MNKKNRISQENIRYYQLNYILYILKYKISFLFFYFSLKLWAKMTSEISLLFYIFIVNLAIIFLLLALSEEKGARLLGPENPCVQASDLGLGFKIEPSFMIQPKRFGLTNGVR